MFVVVQTDAAASDRVVEDAVFAASGLDIEFRRVECRTEDDVLAACVDADAVIPAYAPFTRRVLAGLYRCRIVAVMATGHSCADLAAATELGIVVTHVAGYCTAEVADHTLALLLGLERNIAPLSASVRRGLWDYEAAGKPDRLAGRTLGLIGFGRIGRAVADRARAFGLVILASDPYVNETAMRRHGARPASLDEVIACDIVSLHCALTDETRGILSAARLARMQPTAFLINTARGACIDTDALVGMLQRGTIAGAALDVVEPEPLPAEHPLRALPNAIVTPHAAFLSRQSEGEARERTCRQVVAALRGHVPADVANTDVLGRANCRLRGSDD